MFFTHSKTVELMKLRELEAEILANPNRAARRRMMTTARLGQKRHDKQARLARSRADKSGEGDAHGE